ncbi:hypothetical protein HK098_003157 [Nowakowskiella sp. JEL0407]|nr:hypothetical protein HK098_003157 [Nowakowskiella sp. JEL0407]
MFQTTPPKRLHKRTQSLGAELKFFLTNSITSTLLRNAQPRKPQQEDIIFTNELVFTPKFSPNMRDGDSSSLTSENDYFSPRDNSITMRSKSATPESLSRKSTLRRSSKFGGVDQGVVGIYLSEDIDLSDTDTLVELNKSRASRQNTEFSKDRTRKKLKEVFKCPLSEN